MWASNLYNLQFEQVYNMIEQFKKKKGSVEKNSFGYMFATTKAKHTSEDKVCIQSGNVPISLYKSRLL